MEIPVPLTPGGVGLAAVSVDILVTYPIVVELKATIGLRGDVGTGSVLFRISAMKTSFTMHDWVLNLRLKNIIFRQFKQSTSTHQQDLTAILYLSSL